MAGSNRQDRALMRQRGAGSRTVASANFGLNFGFESGLDEISEEQEREAAHKEVENGGFGLSMPSSGRSLRSTTKIPNSRRSNSRQPSRTPGRRSRETSLIGSTKRAAAGSRREQHDEGGTEAHHQELDNRSAKRRRLSQSATTPRRVLNVGSQGLDSTAQTSPIRHRGMMFTVAEDETIPEQSPTTGREKTNLSERPEESPLFVPQAAYDKENDLRGELSSSKQPDLGMSSRRQTRSSLPASLSSGEASLLNTGDAGDGDANGEGESQRDERAASGLPGDSLGRSSVYELNESIPSKKKRRKKRKSVVLVRKKRSSFERNGASLDRHELPTQDDDSRLPQDVPSSPVLPESAPFDNRQRKRESIQPSRVGTPASYYERSPKEAEEDGDQSYIQESSPDPQTPGPTIKAGTKRKHPPMHGPGTTQTSKSHKSKPTFPILTHRLTNTSALPTIDEDDEGQPHSGSEHNPTVSQHNDRVQPNAVDVLAQICREIIENSIEHMSQTPLASNRTALKNKQNALAAFGKDLEEELFEMSEAVENRINLEGRVRKSKREKSSLQTEFIELRKERERIALKCDAVRRRHWEYEEEARHKWELSEAARRAELEMERNDQVEDEGIEFLLRSVAYEVSSLSDHGGLLERIQSFNGQLERMASILEGRQI